MEALAHAVHLLFCFSHFHLYFVLLVVRGQRCAVDGKWKSKNQQNHSARFFLSFKVGFKYFIVCVPVYLESTLSLLIKRQTSNLQENNEKTRLKQRRSRRRGRGNDYLCALCASDWIYDNPTGKFLFWRSNWPADGKLLMWLPTNNAIIYPNAKQETNQPTIGCLIDNYP